MQSAKKYKHLILTLSTELSSKNMEIMFLNIEIYIAKITNKKKTTNISDVHINAACIWSQSEEL